MKFKNFKNLNEFRSVDDENYAVNSIRDKYERSLRDIKDYSSNINSLKEINTSHWSLKGVAFTIAFSIDICLACSKFLETYDNEHNFIKAYEAMEKFVKNLKLEHAYDYVKEFRRNNYQLFV